jgi:septal ring factor EnvC (AmiA/AmiB activator)
LIDSLAKSEYGWTVHREDRGEEARPHEKPSGRALRSFVAARGHLRLPAAGRIVSHYGNTDIGETFSKGIVIETRVQAGVVAPYDGEVVFAGSFRDYGRIVIIRHSGDYHTLLSGMDEIDCKPGQYLLEGEPIGSMGDSGSTKLYMELREDGRPIDPMKWVKG